MSVCLIGLGSNLGDRQAHLQEALARLQADPLLRVVACSTWRTTSPIGGPAGQGDFLNGALRLETSLAPHALLARLQEIENQLGRCRAERWAPRPIDLDLLLYDGLVLDSPTLVVPHPRMAWRRFVLEPAAEVAAEMLHPTVGWTVGQLLRHLQETRPYVAITGSIAVGKSRLAERLSASVSGRWIVERPNWSQLEMFYREQIRGDSSQPARPPGSALATELEFLEDRARLLSDAAFADCSMPWSVSDFWFDQSAAFAEAWLPAAQFQAYLNHYQRPRPDVVCPRLIVWLDLPADDLLHGIHRRGRACEQRLTVEQLQRIRAAIERRLTMPDVGPVLKINNDNPDASLAEVLAAVQSMQ